MALLQVFTGIACNNKTGCIGQPTYAESVIHETSGKRKKKELMTEVTSTSSVQTCYGSIKTGFKTKSPACYRKPVLDVLNTSCIFSHPSLSSSIFLIINFEYLTLGSSSSTANNGHFNYWTFGNSMLLQGPEETDTHNWQAVLHIVAWSDHAWTSQMRHIVLQGWSITNVSIKFNLSWKILRGNFYTRESYKLNTPPTSSFK